MRRAAAALARSLAALAAAPAVRALELGIQDDRLFLGPPVTADAAPGVTTARGLALATRRGGDDAAA